MEPMAPGDALHFWCLLRLARAIRLDDLSLDALVARLPHDGTTNPAARWYQVLPQWMEHAVQDLVGAIVEQAARTPDWDETRSAELAGRIAAKLAVGDLPPDAVALMIGVPLHVLRTQVADLEHRVARKRGSS